MIKVAIFTTLHERPLVTEIMMLGVERLRVQYSDIFDFRAYAIGHDLERFAPLCDRFDFKLVLSDSEDLLGTKIQKVVRYILKDLQDFNYLMKLDTDDLITGNLLSRWQPEMEKGVPAIGSRDKIVIDLLTRRCKHFKGYPNTEMGVSGGKAIRADIVRKLDGKICRDYLKKGIDYSIKLQLQKAGVEEKLLYTRGNLELKSPVNIHGFDELDGEPYDLSKAMQHLWAAERHFIMGYQAFKIYDKHHDPTIITDSFLSHLL